MDFRVLLTTAGDHFDRGADPHRGLEAVPLSVMPIQAFDSCVSFRRMVGPSSQVKHNNIDVAVLIQIIKSSAPDYMHSHEDRRQLLS